MNLYPLVDVPEPNLLKDTFVYSLPPLIKFEDTIKETIDGKEIEFDPGSILIRDIHITDTTFRDGQQSRPPYSTEQITKIYKMLSRLGGSEGVIRQTEFFLYTKKDREAIDSCRDLGLKFPEITGWIRANIGDFRLVKEMGLKESGMLTSISDYHIFHKQKQTRQEAMDQYLEVVEAALEAGVRPRCHLEDVTRADIKGFVIPFVQRLEKLTENQPKHMKVKIRLCDTMGFGISFPNVSEPRSIPKLIWRMKEECGISEDRLEWHGHNDFHKVHINGTSAWIYGVNALNTTLFGFGERTGNPPLEGALIEYISLKGDLSGIDLSVITEIAEYFLKDIGADIPSNYPFAGRDFNTTRAGIHAGGLRRNEEIYNIFDTTGLLGRPPKVAITDKSGTDGVAIWVNDFLGLKGKERLTLMKVAKVQRWVLDQYEKEGRLTAISDKELEEQVKIYFPDLYKRVKNK
ncbi:MAG TPA: 2-isopropylmalate synthase [Spirochaetes bacterium]|nr:2-isopropylmalate synthase [Spirochaetota bacterium]